MCLCEVVHEMLGVVMSMKRGVCCTKYAVWHVKCEVRELHVLVCEIGIKTCILRGVLSLWIYPSLSLPKSLSLSPCGPSERMVKCLEAVWSMCEVYGVDDECAECVRGSVQSV